MKRHERKRRTREHIIADLSVNHVQRQVLLAGFVADPSMHDYGIDLELTTFNRRGEIEEGTILLQIKATERLKGRRGMTYSCRVERKDLVFWLAQVLPVILIIYDVHGDAAYWLYVQSYFRKLPKFNLFAIGQTCTIKVPIANILDTTAVKRFARFRDRVFEQVEEVVHDED